MFGVQERPPEPMVERFNPVDAAIGVVTAPVLAMEMIALARPWPIGLGIYIAFGVLSGFANLTDANTPAALRDFVGFIYSLVGVLVNVLVFALFLPVIGTGIFYLVARLLGGQGAFSGLFSTQAFASVPGFLLAPLTVVFNILRVPLVGALLSFGFGIWMLALMVLGIRESMGLLTGRAVATLLLSSVPFFVVVVALAGSIANR